MQIELHPAIRHDILKLSKTDFKTKCHKRRLKAKSLMSVTLSHQDRLIRALNNRSFTLGRQTGKSLTTYNVLSKILKELNDPVTPKWANWFI